MVKRHGGGGQCFHFRNNTDLLPTHTAAVVAHRIRREREKDRKGDHALERLMSLTQTARPHVGQLSEQYVGLKRRTRPTRTSQYKLRQGYSFRISANPGPGS
jgi:hypothetical protein